jgi:hypothetical protein
LTTKKYLSQRLQQHKASYKAYLNNKGSEFSLYGVFDKYGCDNFNIYLLEELNCHDINELRAKEGEYLKNTDCINKVMTGRARKQHYQDNKEIKEKRLEKSLVHVVAKF